VSKPRGEVGRPPVTSRGELEQVALELFAERGFEATTVDDIAAASGISRRTFFRYFPSKNDVVWGDFESLLAAMDDWLVQAPADVPVLESLADAVVRFNSLPPEAVPAHRERMALILHVPALQAHATLRYADWRAVVARFVARRAGGPAAAAVPHLVGHVALGAAVASYEQWLASPDADLSSLLAASFAELRAGFPSLATSPARGRGGRPVKASGRSRRSPAAT
jgi:TetR/AcrR family transcriptional regulator, regulator of mycofactocin system